MSFDYTFPLNGSNMGAIIEWIVAGIQELALSGIDAENVVARSASWDTNLIPPYVIVRPAPEIIDPNSGSNEKAQVNYAYIVSMVASNTADVAGPMTLFGLPMRWREQVRVEFQNKSHPYWNGIELPMTGATVNRSIVMDGEPFIEQALMRGYMAQYLAIRVNVTEPIGVIVP